ncbi:MAG TPA: response regulator [Chitinophagaceae bacterium]|nr:response regulator [Chitinophagaceae bacterium]
MNASRPYILLADDNADDQSFIRDAFAYIKAGIDLKIVDSGIELLENLELTDDALLPCLIVLDYNMPELNGAEVLEVLVKEAKYAGIPKILLSTSYYKKHIDYCLKLGATGYLIKPDNFFDWKRLAHKMLTYIEPGKL